MSKAGAKILRGLREAIVHARAKRVRGLKVHDPRTAKVRAGPRRSPHREVGAN